MADCFKTNGEKGLWFEVLSLQRLIASRESKGIDASAERNLLKAWRKAVPEDYAGAEQIIKDGGYAGKGGHGETLQGVSSLVGNQRELVLQQGINSKPYTVNKMAVVLQQKAAPKHAGGRPRKEGAVHRTTKWRRKKETQGVLI